MPSSIWLPVGIMAAIVFVALAFAVASPARAAGLCGSTERGVVARRALPSLARGASVSDPAFGCTITRLTDAAADGVGGYVHQYSSINPFNADATHVLLARPDGVMQVRDLRGAIVRDNLNRLGVVDRANPLWSRTDPKILYFHTRDGNELKTYDVGTNEVRTLRRFDAYRTISFGLGEGDISWDGDHIPVVGDGRFGFIHTISTGASTAVVDIATSGATIDNVDVTSGNLFTVVRIGPNGTDLYDSAMRPLGRVLDYKGHSDRGRMSDGRDVIVMTNSNDATPIASCQNGIVRTELPGGTERCLLPLDWDLAVHVSCNNVGQDWCLVSTYGGSGVPYAGEVFRVPFDGGTPVRLAQTRSSEVGYYGQPRAAVSHDGRYVLFDSDVGGTMDVYLLRTDVADPVVRAPAPAPTPTPVSAPTPPPTPPVVVAADAGMLVKSASSSAVYRINDDETRSVFPNAATYFTWYPDFSDVQVITDTALAAYPLSRVVTIRPGSHLVKIQSDPKVYAVETDGVLRWIPTEQDALTRYGTAWTTTIIDIPVSLWPTYTVGAPLSLG
ncbi:MAG: hypothetical protein Q7T01_00690 [bacterium]|nr:hypothetical protein [bacterium]